MDNAQVAVAKYCPDWWPASTRLLIRRVLLDPAQVSADPRSRRRRTLHPDQRALPLPELAAWLHQLTATALGQDIVHGYGVRGGKGMIATLHAAADRPPCPVPCAGSITSRYAVVTVVLLSTRRGRGERDVFAVPGRLIRHARHLTLRLPPGHSLLPEVLARLRALPAPA